MNGISFKALMLLIGSLDVDLPSEIETNPAKLDKLGIPLVQIGERRK